MVGHHSDISRIHVGTVSKKALFMDADKVRTLLIIDDEKDMCMLLSRALRTFFGHIEVAYTLAEGTAIAAQILPDVIILDNNLPDGYGLDNIDAFRNGDAVVKIVLVSAMEIGYESLAAGADDFISKPVDMAALKTIIEKKKDTKN
jgi:DNA-binding response OmpR family regulator